MSDFELFNIPTAANREAVAGPVLGGFGGGTYQISASGAFTSIDLEPRLRIDTLQLQNHIYLRSNIGGYSQVVALSGANFSPSAELFPCTWVKHEICPELKCESQWFSPIIPGRSVEPILPIGLIVIRVRNESPKDMDLSLLFTHQAPVSVASGTSKYDLQHDNLCLTGSLGDSNSQNRHGISVPDLHSQGIYLQSVEPWSVPMDLDQIIQDFEDDGELDPRNVSHDNQGAAAYIKFKLEPNEIREIPCVVAWHYPYFATGDLAGEPKFYVQHLGRFRPDNAIVWLAEQAYEDYGTEAATYTHWMRQISDWHATIKDSMELDNLVRLRSSGLVGTADSGWKLYGNKASDELISAFSEAELVTLNSWPDLWEAVRN